MNKSANSEIFSQELKRYLDAVAHQYGINSASQRQWYRVELFNRLVGKRLAGKLHQEGSGSDRCWWIEGGLHPPQLTLIAHECASRLQMVALGVLRDAVEAEQHLDTEHHTQGQQMQSKGHMQLMRQRRLQFLNAYRSGGTGGSEGGIESSSEGGGGRTTSRFHSFHRALSAKDYCMPGQELYCASRSMSNGFMGPCLIADCRACPAGFFKSESCGSICQCEMCAPGRASLQGACSRMAMVRCWW
jgi:hypothetical protein